MCVLPKKFDRFYSHLSTCKVDIAVKGKISRGEVFFIYGGLK